MTKPQGPLALLSALPEEQAGLVDKLGDAKSAAKDAFGADKLYEYSTPKSLVENLMGGLGVKVAQELKPKVEGPMAMPY